MKALIVDDEEGICKRLQRELKKNGFEVEYTTSPVGVIERLHNAKKKEEPYELLLLDLIMPEVNGFKLLREIREARLDIDVVIITGYGDEEKAMEAIRLGAVDYLRKPISLEELHTAIFRIQQKREFEAKKILRHSILVVDDEIDLCRRIERELEKEGYQTTVAYDGVEGMDYFKNYRVDVVIADIKMPRMSGLEMLKACREITDDFVSIIITDHGDHETAIEALKLGASNYLKKPISLEELIVSVNNGIDLLLLRRGLSAHRRELEIKTALKEQYAKNLEKMVEERTKEIKKLSDAVHASTDSIIISDLDGKITDINEATLKMYSTDDQTDLVGKGSFDLIATEDRDKAVADMKEAMERGYVRDREYQIVIKDGSKVPVEMSVSVMKGVDGKPIGFVGIIRDITERKHVEEELKQYTERLKALSYRLLEVQENERRYIARELHDEIGQALTGLKLSLEGIASLPAEEIMARLSEVQESVRELLNRVRNMSLDLRPSMLDDLGLLPALLWHFDRYTSQTNVRVNFKHIGLDKRFRSEIETAVYRIIQEALTNVARHACTREVTVLISVIREEIFIINIEDRGIGFDFNTIKSTKVTAGIGGMRERVALLGGKMMIDSSPGIGTCINVEIPLKDSLGV